MTAARNPRSHHPLARTAGLLCAVVMGVSMLALPALADPAAIASARGSLRARADASFERFAERWLADLRTRERQARRAGQDHSGPGKSFELELRPTGKSRSPYVGLLRYTEHRVECARVGHCQRVGTQHVTEIFRFQNGKWVY